MIKLHIVHITYPHISACALNMHYCDAPLDIRRDIVNDSNNPPANATLSHSWHVDDSQEVDFHDVKTSRGTPKPGLLEDAFEI